MARIMPPSPPQPTLFGSPFTPVQIPSHLPGSVPAATATNPTLNASHKRPAESDLEPSDRYSRTFAAAKNVPSNADDRVITLIVGPNKTVFYVHESKLSSKAEYFKVALAGNWQEANNGVFTLQEENGSVFNLFVHWLYHDVILPISFEPDAEILLIEAYFLGDRRGSEEFKNCVLNRLRIVWNMSAVGVSILPSSEAISLAFSEETQSPNLRKLIADKHAWEGEHDTLLQQATDDLVHPGFVSAVFIAFLKRVSTVTISVLEAKCKATHTVSGIQVKDQKHDFDDIFVGTKCRNVGCVETRPKAADTKVLRSDKEAPYAQDFCAHYHEHSRSAKCFSAFSSSAGFTFGKVSQPSMSFLGGRPAF